MIYFRFILIKTQSEHPVDVGVFAVLEMSFEMPEMLF